MKRLISVCLVLLFVCALFSLQTYAYEEQGVFSDVVQNDDEAISQRILYTDGSSLEIYTATVENSRDRGTKTGSRTYTKKDSSGEIEWKATLTATFFYTGSNAACTGASCAVTIYDSDWYVVSNSTSHSGNTATTQLTMGYKVLGITVYTHTYTITLSCDANGNLS